MTLLTHLRRFATRHALWRPDTRVVAAVSGGADSVAMLFLLHELHSRGELRLESVAHLNHRIRADAEIDEMFCRDLATRLGIAFSSASIDVPSRARQRKESLEVAGRNARRTFLNDVRNATGADCIATAHTKDDQAETILLRLVRGAGSRGLAGIMPCRQGRIRPVLSVTRQRLRQYLTALGESWREDQTNTDLSNPRNRVRHELLPYLEREFNPAIRQALARAADTARADHAILARLTASAALTLIEHRDGTRMMNAADLRSLPEGLARRVVADAILAAGGRASYDEIAEVLEVAAGRSVAADLFRVRVEHFAGNVVLISSSSSSTAAPPREPFCLQLLVPGAVQTRDGWVVEAQAFERPQRRDPRPDVAQIDAAVVAGNLFVRRRRPGDRLRPVGLGGTKKLQDVLVDRKVTRRQRDAVPIVTDKQGRIVWVAGHVLGEDFRVTEGTKGVIILKLRRI